MSHCASQNMTCIAECKSYVGGYVGYLIVIQANAVLYHFCYVSRTKERLFRLLICDAYKIKSQKSRDISRRRSHVNRTFVTHFVKIRKKTRVVNMRVT